MPTNDQNFDFFFAGYVEALLWSSHAEDPETAEDIEDLRHYEINDDAQRLAYIDCRRFYEDNAAILALVCRPFSDSDPNRYTYSSAGYDLALTRNGHGVGFWDRGFGEIGDRLSKAAEDFGSVYCYIDPDGLIGFEYNRLLTFRDLVLNRKYYQPSAAAFLKMYQDNEQINDHAGNVVLCAMFAGSNVDLYIAYDLQRQQNKAGHLSPVMAAARADLMHKIAPELVRKGARYAAGGLAYYINA